MSPPTDRRAGEVSFCALMLALSTFLLWACINISGFKSYASAGSFPMAASLLLVICALIILVKTVLKPLQPLAGGGSLVRQFFQQIAPPVVVWTGVAITLYMVTLDWIGFVPSSYLFLIVAMRILGGMRIGLNLLVSAVVLSAIYVVFDTAFSVVLPTGTVWQGMFK